MNLVIADPGSCHLGRKDLAKELIKTAKGCGADAIKFQLFKNMPPNIPLPYHWVGWLKEFADNLKIELFASIWDIAGLRTLVKAGCTSVKFAYSQRCNEGLYNLADQKGIKTKYVSGDVYTVFNPTATKLYCIPEYPVAYTVNFEGIFPRFDGFSSHCLGISQDLEAIRAGAKIIEKHIRLNYPGCDNVPDGRFALRANEFYKLCKLGKDIPS